MGIRRSVAIVLMSMAVGIIAPGPVHTVIAVVLLCTAFLISEEGK